MSIRRRSTAPARTAGSPRTMCCWPRKAKEELVPLRRQGPRPKRKLRPLRPQRLLRRRPGLLPSQAHSVGGRNEERVKMTRLRQTIATRLKEAQNTAALLTTFNDVDMSAVIDARARYKDLFEKKHGIRLGFMGFFVKAVALAAARRARRSTPGSRATRSSITTISTSRSRCRRPRGWSSRSSATPTDELRRDREGHRRLRQEGQGRHADRRRHEGRHLHHLQRRRVRLPAVDPDHQPAAVGGARHAPDRGAPGGAATARSSPGR